MLYIYIYILCLYSSLQVQQFQSFPVPLSIRALYLPVLFPKKMVNPDNKVQLYHIRLRRCAHNVRTCYAGNAGGILHLGHEMKAYFWPVDGKGNLLPEHGFQASYEVHQYSPPPPPPPPPLLIIVLFIVDESVQIRMRRFIVLFPQSSAILAFEF